MEKGVCDWGKRVEAKWKQFLMKMVLAARNWLKREEEANDQVADKKSRKGQRSHQGDLA